MSRRLRFIILAGYVCVAFAAWAGWIGSRGWDAVRPESASLAPSSFAWFGTDHLGRDVLSRIIQGSRIAFLVGLVAALLSVGFGTAMGLLCAWKRGAIDRAISVLATIFTAIPGIILVLLVGWILGPGIWTTGIAIGVAGWVGTYRLMRTEALRLQEESFVESAVLEGAKTGRILIRHLLPNLTAIFKVQFFLHFVYAIKTEVIISFLGLGPVDSPSWGRMIAHATYDLANGMWWPILFATLALAGLVFALQDDPHSPKGAQA